MRSLTDPNGFWLSSLARMRTSGFGESADTSTIGVWPMRSSTLSLTLAMVSMVRYAFPTAVGSRHSPMDLVNNLPAGGTQVDRHRSRRQTTATGSSVTVPSTMR